MQPILNFINNVLNPIGIVVGLILAIPVFWTWWQVVFGERRKQRRWLYEVSNNPGLRPGILVIDLLPGRNILASVRHYLSATESLKTIPLNRLVCIQRDKPFIPSETYEFGRQVRDAARRLFDMGCDVVHLFYGGPDVGALIVGAEFANGPRVLLYHHEQGSYVLFGPLEPLRANH